MEPGQRRNRWAGVALAERQARRRAGLIDAGIDLLGGADGPTLTVRAVCRQAGLTERYFYESFSDRDEFVRAVYDEVSGTAMSALTTAAEPRTAVERFVALMVDTPTRGRVLLLAPAAEPALAGSGAAWMPTFIDLLARRMEPAGDADTRRMAAISLVGGLSALFTAYLDGRLSTDRSRFIDYCVDFVTRQAAAAASTPPRL